MGKPSEDIAEWARANGGPDGAARAAYAMYLKKYGRPAQAEATEPFRDKFLTPGRIYAFVYRSDAAPEPGREFIDRRPILLSMGAVALPGGKVVETGLDLMAVPPKVRGMLLDRLDKYFGREIARARDDADAGHKVKRLPLDRAAAKALFRGLGWDRAYAVFDRAMMASVRIVDYDDWGALGHLQTRGIEGRSIKDLYSEYIKRMTAVDDKTK